MQKMPCLLCLSGNKGNSDQELKSFNISHLKILYHVDVVKCLLIQLVVMVDYHGMKQSLCCIKGRCYHQTSISVCVVVVWSLSSQYRF